MAEGKSLSFWYEIKTPFSSKLVIPFTARLWKCVYFQLLVKSTLVLACSKTTFIYSWMQIDLFIFFHELYHLKQYLNNYVHTFCLNDSLPLVPIAFIIHFLPLLEFPCLPIDSLLLFWACLPKPHPTITRPNLPCSTVGLEIFQRQKRTMMKKGWLHMEQRGEGVSNVVVIDISDRNTSTNKFTEKCEKWGKRQKKKKLLTAGKVCILANQPVGKQMW